MSITSRILALIGWKRDSAPVEAAFAPGRSAWRDALLDEGLDARSFPVLHPERESLPRELDRPGRAEGRRDNRG